MKLAQPCCATCCHTRVFSPRTLCCCRQNTIPPRCYSTTNHPAVEFTQPLYVARLLPNRLLGRVYMAWGPCNSSISRNARTHFSSPRRYFPRLFPRVTSTSSSSCCSRGVRAATPLDFISPLLLHAPRVPTVILRPRHFRYP